MNWVKRSSKYFAWIRGVLFFCVSFFRNTLHLSVKRINIEKLKFESQVWGNILWEVTFLAKQNSRMVGTFVFVEILFISDKWECAFSSFKYKA